MSNNRHCAIIFLVWPCLTCFAATLPVCSQGMTIDLLRVNLDGCFAPGQAYVACSRGKSTDTMVVESFSEERIITSELAKGFYNSLKDGMVYNPPTWSDVLENAKEESQIKDMMAERYRSERCRRCGSVCIIYNVKKAGPNHGRWVVQCMASYDRYRSSNGRQSENGHMYQFVPAPPVTNVKKN